jgi:subtilisin family serine protease
VNIRVLNASWGNSGFSQALMDEISSANTHNMLFVTGAGNASANNNSIPTYPANFNLPNIISVAATTNYDALVPSSNFGSSTVHLGAPGWDIISLYFRSSGSVSYFSGTSMSSAMVAGGAALVLAACPESTSALKASLLNNVDVIPALSGKTISGGRLNIAKAINSCPGGVSTYSFSGNLISSVGIRTISAVLTVAGTAGYSGNAKFSALSCPAE